MRQHASRLHRRGRDALGPDAHLQGVRSRREHALGVAHVHVVAGLDVVGYVFEDQGRVRILDSLRVGQGRQLLVVDVDQLDRILRLIARFSHHGCHRLADVAHDALGQDLDRGRPDLGMDGRLQGRRGRLLVEHQVGDPVLDVVPGEHGNDAWRRASRRDFDRADARVWQRAA